MESSLHVRAHSLADYHTTCFFRLSLLCFVSRWLTTFDLLNDLPRCLATASGKYRTQLMHEGCFSLFSKLISDGRAHLGLRTFDHSPHQDTKRRAMRARPQGAASHTLLSSAPLLRVFCSALPQDKLLPPLPSSRVHLAIGAHPPSRLREELNSEEHAMLSKDRTRQSGKACRRGRLASDDRHCQTLALEFVQIVCDRAAADEDLEVSSVIRCWFIASMTRTFGIRRWTVVSRSVSCNISLGGE